MDAVITALAAAVEYNPVTGDLRWRARDGEDRHTKAWNTRYAGTSISGRDRHGYVNFHFRRRVFRVHRVAWAMVHGRWPHADIDHINGDRADNRLENLREATRSENNYNRHAPNTGQFHRGVTLHKASGLYRAYIFQDGRQISLGYYKTPDEARNAYLLKAPAIIGEFHSEWRA